MRPKAQRWISISNREESMARTLSRAGLFEGTVLHAHRAALAALRAVFADHGWALPSDRCEDVCALLRAHDITPPRNVAKAAQTLDAHQLRLDPDAPEAPSAACTDEIAVACLDAVTRIRNLVNTVLTR